ncbi:MAG: biotin/lipoyl-containing protein [Candidatus Methylomirabilales bacterium]
MRRYTIEVAGQPYVIEVQEITADRYQVLADGQEFEVRLTGDEDVAEASIRPEISSLRPGQPAAAGPPPPPPPPAAPRGAPRPLIADQRAGTLTAPMPGKILTVDVAVGDRVSRGQVLITLEAMKMKNSLRAPHDGVVLELTVQPGQSVGHGDALLRLGEN